MRLAFLLAKLRFVLLENFGLIFRNRGVSFDDLAREEADLFSLND